MTKAEMSKLMKIIKIPYTLIIGLFHNILTPILLVLLILMVFDYHQRKEIHTFVDTEIIESISRCNDKSFTIGEWRNINDDLKQNNYTSTRLHIYVIANRYGYCGDKNINTSKINISKMVGEYNK